ncbi:HU domain-containing protein [Mucilaginibacter phyllosphaerae]|uniref:Cell division protein FtsN n=1 Tax=Mucilaginibacter phyllosphaerae TaxID=1812349 RepID=A0A4Y8AGS6_9SPHI|nr:SPOR domain-containing protein [Mucilaginibacter phyllosphaerae]MBB3968429.1 cell division protein FtsN [Mucilaginibacter phyllosphaerae]TEW67923.1 SPOR domain-containing protein [Mucilaginibacter phyllosphaerae]GGH16056.1 hypothetical protein GCM10007352_25210 [Mucilaginibacter phyllosphaerae]
MDVGNFISELLAQQGEVNVPGLGYFAHTRNNGHYNEQQAILYPPAYHVQFDPEFTDDQILAQHIADRKNISLASSKYFTEKYINNIKLQAQDAEIPMADLGWFYTEDDQLYFRANTSTNTDPDFFGYQPITLPKLGAARAEETPAAYEPAQEYAAPVAIPQPQKQQEQPPEGYRYETDEEHEEHLIRLVRKRKITSTLVFVTLTLLLTALVIYLVNRYDPTIFNRDTNKVKVTKTEPVINAKVTPIEIEDTTAKDTVKTAVNTDSLTVAAKAAPVTDTAAKIKAPVNNTITGPRYEILAGAFYTAAKAKLEIQKYEKMGFEAYIADGVPGKKVNVSLGTFKTKAEANAAFDKIIKTGKIKPKDVYVLPVNIR